MNINSRLRFKICSGIDQNLRTAVRSRPMLGNLQGPIRFREQLFLVCVSVVVHARVRACVRACVSVLLLCVFVCMRE